MPVLLALAGLGSDTAEGQERLDALRYAAGSAARQLVGSAEEIAFDFGVSSVEEIEAIAHGAVLGNFVEEGLRGKTQDSIKEEIDSILIVSSIDQEELRRLWFTPWFWVRPLRMLAAW